MRPKEFSVSVRPCGARSCVESLRRADPLRVAYGSHLGFARRVAFLVAKQESALTRLLGCAWPPRVVWNLDGPRLVRARFARAGNDVTSEVFFGCESVVGTAAQGHVFQPMFAAESNAFT
jgi:hypothetical protein